MRNRSDIPAYQPGTPELTHDERVNLLIDRESDILAMWRQARREMEAKGINGWDAMSIFMNAHYPQLSS